jgi:ABC-type transport system substrate-binding protein
LSWTFKIRKDVKFHTGTGLDAQMVKDSINRTITRRKGVSGSYLKMKKFDGYWKGWKGKHVNNIEFKIIPDNKTIGEDLKMVKLI